MLVRTENLITFAKELNAVVTIMHRDSNYRFNVVC